MKYVIKTVKLLGALKQRFTLHNVLQTGAINPFITDVLNIYFTSSEIKVL